MGRFEQIIEARQKLCEAAPGTNTPPVTPHTQPAVNSAPDMTAADVAAFEAGQPNQNKAIDDYLRTQTPEQIAQIKASLASVANQTGANVAQTQQLQQQQAAAQQQTQQTAQQQSQQPQTQQQQQQQTAQQNPYQTGANMASSDVEDQRKRQAAQAQPQPV